jgi:hypothetical protein
MTEIEKVFNDTFQAWNIILPPEALETRQRGRLSASGWTIQYLFGQDEAGHYLDYYATHRMTNDRHVRIYENGQVVTLEAPLEFMVFPAGSSAEEQARIREEYIAENRRIYAALAAKGFN